jgi:hypothetical protein
MRRFGMGAVALVLAITALPLQAAAAADTAAGSEAFCEAGQELKDLYAEARGLDIKNRRKVEELRAHVEAVRDVAPRSLASSFPILLRFYRLIERGEISLTDPDREDRYSDESEKAAHAALRIARRLDNECGISFRG